MSMLFEPVVRGDTTVGVLSVGWDRPVRGIDQPTARAVKLLAIEAAVAIERADLLAGLSEMAEEFAVALPSRAAPEAEVVLDRLRTFTPENQTCSIGLAEWGPGESALDLVARADEALYEAKRSGRDALVVA